MPEARPLRPGDPAQVGDYEVVGRLGEGGIGTVFLGLSPAGGSVAIRVMHPQVLGDAAARVSFINELTIAQRVMTSCTAQMIDTGLLDGVPYIVSEYVRGPSLLDLVESEGPRGPRPLERLAVGLATGLSALHRTGIVHRDIRPANVLLASDGPRLIDFGIARALEAVGVPPVMTAGQDYLSPEQLTGGTVGPAADIFGWGSTMLYAATGRPPFGHGTVPEVAGRIVYDDPDLSGLPDALRDVVAATLSKDLAQRPTALQLLDLLIGTGRSPGGRGDGESAEVRGPIVADPRPAPSAPEREPADPGGFDPSGLGPGGAGLGGVGSGGAIGSGTIGAGSSGAGSSAPHRAETETESLVNALLAGSPGSGPHAVTGPSGTGGPAVPAQSPPLPADPAQSPSVPAPRTGQPAGDHAGGAPADYAPIDYSLPADYSPRDYVPTDFAPAGPSPSGPVRPEGAVPYGTDGAATPTESTTAFNSPSPTAGMSLTSFDDLDDRDTGPRGSDVRGRDPYDRDSRGADRYGRKPRDRNRRDRGGRDPGQPGLDPRASGFNATSVLDRPEAWSDTPPPGRNRPGGALGLPGLNGLGGNRTLGIAVSVGIGLLIGILVVTLLVRPYFNGRKASGSSSPSPGSSALDNTPVDSVPATFKGTWRGTAVNQDGNTFEVTAVFKEGQNTATVRYTPMNCVGVLTLVRGTRARMEMTLTNARPCTDGNVVVTKQVDGTVIYGWRHPGSRHNYRATLKAG